MIKQNQAVAKAEKMHNKKGKLHQSVKSEKDEYLTCRPQAKRGNEKRPPWKTRPTSTTDEWRLRKWPE